MGNPKSARKPPLIPINKHVFISDVVNISAIKTGKIQFSIPKDQITFQMQTITYQYNHIKRNAVFIYSPVRSFNLKICDVIHQVIRFKIINL